MYKLITNIKDIKGNKIKILIEGNQIKKILSDYHDIHIDCETISMNGEYVSMGWIDSHVHANKSLNPYGDEPDNIGIKQGVPVVIDAGSIGILGIDEFYNYSKKYKTELYSIVNLAHQGISSIGELKRSEDFASEEEVKKFMNKYPDFIKGIKIRVSNSISGNNGINAIKEANKIIKNLDIKGMIHIGNSPPSILEILSEINNNFIITHTFNGKKNGIFKNLKSIKKLLDSKINNGVLLDVGHGSASFSFKAFKNAIQNKYIPDIISTDIYKENREKGPVYSLALVASKCLNAGMSLNEVINSITINPAKIFGIKGLERGLIEGAEAKLTFFKVENIDLKVEDSDGEKKILKQMIIPTAVMQREEIYNVKRTSIFKFK